jgi:hypothetical protein
MNTSAGLCRCHLLQPDMETGPAVIDLDLVGPRLRPGVAALMK